MDVHLNKFLRFTDLRIGSRLALGFFLLIALMLGLTAIGMNRVANINHSLSTIGDINSVKQRYAINFRGSVHDRAISLRDLTLVQTQEQVLAEIALIKKLASNYAQSAQPMDQMMAASELDADESAAFEKIREIESRAKLLTAKVIELRLANQGEAAIQLLLGQAGPAYIEWLAKINQLIDLEEAKNKAESANARSFAQGFSVLMLVLSATAVLVAIVTAWSITRSIVQPIRQAVNEAENMATGNLASAIHVRNRDETGQMLQALESLRTSFRIVLTDVRNGSEAVAETSSGIYRDNHAVAARTETQASAIEETAASMEELGSTVRQNASDAKQASQLAGRASLIAIDGGRVVAEVVATMRGINDSSQKISDIIGVIDAIAFQTNILSLNAAVEAARAGEQGKGFAVVASEVRNLAMRSAEAAREIKGLIATSGDWVAQGSAMVNKAGETMSEVVQSIQHVTDIVEKISAASEEQALGVAQVGQAVGEIDQATQKNSALISDMADAANAMSEKSQRLLDAVRIFQLGHHESATPATGLARRNLRLTGR